MTAIHQTPPTGPEVAKMAGIKQHDMAERLGISRSAIAQWDEVPLARVLPVSELTGISPASIRPDVFGKLEAAQ